MKRRLKGIQIVLVVVIVVSIPVFSTYLYFNCLADADLLSSTLNFENFDQELVSWAEQQYPLMVCGLDSFSTLFFPDRNISNQVRYVSFQESATFEKTSILRC